MGKIYEVWTADSCESVYFSEKDEALKYAISYIVDHEATYDDLVYTLKYFLANGAILDRIIIAEIELNPTYGFREDIYSSN